MRIGINGSFWNQPATGSGQYLRELLPALARRAPENEYQVIRPEPDGAGAYAVPDRVSFSSERPALRFAGDNIAKLWFEQVTFPRACRRESFDLAHVPYFASPLLPSTRTVVTIHDLIPLILPLYRGSLLVRLYTRLVSQAACRANAVIADSECSKRDIVARLGIPGQRVHVVYLAADARYRPVQDTRSVRAKYRLPDKFVLYLGGYDSRKNVKAILKGMALAPGLYGQGYRLVLAGSLPGAHSDFFPDPRRMAHEAGLAEDAVQYIGAMAEGDKPALLSAAVLFLFPSLYEGFGLPPLEAMACGTPVISSNAASLPEIVGDAAVRLDPREPPQWADAMAAVCSDAPRREEMRARGLAQAARFSWDRAACETLAVYAGAEKA